MGPALFDLAEQTIDSLLKRKKQCNGESHNQERPVFFDAYGDNRNQRLRMQTGSIGIPAEVQTPPPTFQFARLCRPKVPISLNSAPIWIAAATRTGFPMTYVIRRRQEPPSCLDPCGFAEIPSARKIRVVRGHATVTDFEVCSAGVDSDRLGDRSRTRDSPACR